MTLSLILDSNFWRAFEEFIPYMSFLGGGGLGYLVHRRKTERKNSALFVPPRGGAS